MSNTNTSSTNLNLEVSTSKQPRKLAIFKNEILAYGGDSGYITALPLDTHISDTTDKESRIVQRHDDAVRTVTLTKDHSCIAVGYETGSIDLFFLPTKEELDKIASTTNSTQEDDEEDWLDGGDLLTQTSITGGTTSDKANALDCCGIGSSYRQTLGFRCDAPIRSIEFDPRSSPKNGYFLAIATESTHPGFLVVDATPYFKNPKEMVETPVKKFLVTGEAKDAHKDGVRSLSYSPNGEMIASLGMDGKMCLWNTKGISDPDLDWELLQKDPHQVVPKVDVGEFNGADTVDRSVIPVWFHDSDGNDEIILALPGNSYFKFRRISRNGDEFTGVDQDCLIANVFGGSTTATSKEIVSIAFDPTTSNDEDSCYAITSSRDGKIHLWQINMQQKDGETEHGKCVSEIHHDESICTNVQWYKDSATNKEILLLALENGTLITLHGREKIIPPSPSPYVDKEMIDDDDSQSINSSQSLSNNLITQPSNPPSSQSSSQETISKNDSKTNDNVHDDGDDDDDSMAIFEEGEKGLQGNNFIMDEADEDDNVSHGRGNNPSTNNSTEAAVNQADIGADDYSLAGPVDDLDGHFDKIVNELESDHPTQRKIAALPEPQAPFAPSSTPIDDNWRILCWNHIGTVTSRNSDNAVNHIDIAFADSATRRPVSFKDNVGFLLGSLGEDGALFASDIDAENDDMDDDSDFNGMSDRVRDRIKNEKRRKAGYSGSNIYFHRFESFDAQKDKDWNLTLPDGERVLGCACGNGWCAVVTSRHFLRIFSSGGVQGAVKWIRGKPVTLIGRDDFIGVIYHESNPLMDGTQKLGYTMYAGLTGNEISSGSVAGMSAGSSLTWAGFSNDDCLCVVDNDGMMSMLISDGLDDTSMNVGMNWTWLPMLDMVGLKKSSGDTFWPISIQDGKLICAPLKGGVQYPDASRRPITTLLPLRIPLAKGKGGRNDALEEVSLRANLVLQQKKFKKDYTNSIYMGSNTEELENQYITLSAQVDKVTLKLFVEFMQGGKLERALDLTQRLHLEKSFDIAADISDRMNHQDFSDRIIDAKEDRFQAPQDDEDSLEDVEDNMSIASTNPTRPPLNPMKRSRYQEDVTPMRKVKQRSYRQSDSEDDEHDEAPKPRPMNPFAKRPATHDSPTTVATSRVSKLRRNYS